MYYSSKSELSKLERQLYRIGMTGGISITAVRIPNTDLMAQKDVNYLYSNTDIIIRIYRLRNEHGVWCDTVRIEFENMNTGKVIVFDAIGGNNND